MLMNDAANNPEEWEIFAKQVGDSPHKIISDVRLSGGAKLHRFKNGAGVKYSAIVQNGIELWNCERKRESAMVEKWNEIGWKE